MEDALVTILFLLIPISLGLAGFFVGCFVWAMKKGQYDDMDTQAYRPLLDDDEEK